MNVALLSLPPAKRRGTPASLVAQLGGNASVPAFYDVRYGITASGGLASQWDDARGSSGFGPSLTAAGAARPAWDGNVLTFDGVNTNIASAASGTFDLSGAKSLIYVGDFQADAVNTRYPVGIADGAGTARALMLRRDATGTAKLFANSGVLVDSGVANGATRRIAIATKDAATTATMQVPSHVAVSGTPTATAGGNNVLTVGAYFSTPSLPCACTVRAVLVLSRAATAQDVATILLWAQSNHAAVAA